MVQDQFHVCPRRCLDENCCYQLFVSSSSEILEHEDLKGKIKTACLGSLLLPDQRNRLEDQYLTDKEVENSMIRKHSSQVFSFLSVSGSWFGGLWFHKDYVYVPIRTM